MVESLNVFALDKQGIKSTTSVKDIEGKNSNTGLEAKGEIQAYLIEVY